MAEYTRLDLEISSMQEELQKLPTGKLFITRNKTRFKWYINNGEEILYLPKSQRPRAEALAKKKYLTLRVKEFIREKEALAYYLRHHSKDAYPSEKLLDNSPFQELLNPYFKSATQKLARWIEEPYEKSVKYPEQLIHKSISGNVVRSKSESIIDMSLYLNKLPFRYECALQLGDVKLYPDFTILHPRTREIYYWEHFGMMDNPVYSKNACSKMQLYISNKIFPADKLITTYETLDHPLSSEIVEKIIRFTFLEN